MSYQGQAGQMSFYILHPPLYLLPWAESHIIVCIIALIFFFIWWTTDLKIINSKRALKLLETARTWNAL